MAEKYLINSIAGGSSNGRTSPFEGEYRGSNPCPPAMELMHRGSIPCPPAMRENKSKKRTWYNYIYARFFGF